MSPECQVLTLYWPSSQPVDACVCIIIKSYCNSLTVRKNEICYLSCPGEIPNFLTCPPSVWPGFYLVWGGGGGGGGNLESDSGWGAAAIGHGSLGVYPPRCFFFNFESGSEAF